MSDISNGYIEMDNLFVEWEFVGSIMDGPDPTNTSLEIINVQLRDPKDLENTERWIDITDYMTPETLEQLRGQIDEYYIDQYHE